MEAQDWDCRGRQLWLQAFSVFPGCLPQPRDKGACACVCRPRMLTRHLSAQGLRCELVAVPTWVVRRRV